MSTHTDTAPPRAHGRRHDASGSVESYGSACRHITAISHGNAKVESEVRMIANLLRGFSPPMDTNRSICGHAIRSSIGRPSIATCQPRILGTD